MGGFYKGEEKMEAHEYIGILGSAAGRTVTAKMIEDGRGFIRQLDRDGYEYMNKVRKLGADGAVAMEAGWIRIGRPYYIVYPVACEALLRVRLDIPASALRLPAGLGSVALRFCVGREVEGISAILIQREAGDNLMGVFIQALDGQENATFGIASDALTVEEQLQERIFKNALNGLKNPMSVFAAMKIACGICLLGEDSEWVEPDVLSKDRLKFEQTGDPAIVERAKRRGKFGWVVGGNIDTAPHLRRPHLGIRWTGEKGLIPKLVPISGSVVRKKRLSEVPHGYQKDHT